MHAASVCVYVLCVCKGVLGRVCVRECRGQGSLLYLTVKTLSASLFAQTFGLLLQGPFCVALPSLLL